MKCKRLIAALLQMTLVTAAIAQQPSVKTQDLPPSTEAQGQQLSASEESEARALAADFLARFEDSGDIASLMQMHTSDFIKRGRQNKEGSIADPIATIDESVIAEASDKDLLKCYTETINFFYFMVRHYGAAAWLRKQSSINDDDKDYDLPITKTLPGEVIELLKSNSITRELVRADEKSIAPAGKTDVTESTEVAVSAEITKTPSTDASEEFSIESDSNDASSAIEKPAPPKPEDRWDTIKTLSGLRDYVRTLEKANGLLRISAKSLPTMKTLMEALKEKSSAGEQSTDGDEDSLNPRLYVLSEEWFGYAAGERLICVDVLIFHMDLVRVDGRLQVAALYFPTSCNSG